MGSPNLVKKLTINHGSDVSCYATLFHVVKMECYDPLIAHQPPTNSLNGVFKSLNWDAPGREEGLFLIYHLVSLPLSTSIETERLEVYSAVKNKVS